MASPLFATLVASLNETYGDASAQEIARRLGVAPQTVENWLSGKAQPNATSLGKLLDLYVDHRTSMLFRPLVEFAPITPERTRSAWRFAKDDEALLKPLLADRRGIYVYYDSAGEATYLGKSGRDLWSEARKRLLAEANRPFYAPDKGPSRRQGDIARFLSAYEVTVPAAIDNVETFMLRAFANDLMNRNSGKFKALMHGGRG